MDDHDGDELVIRRTFTRAFDIYDQSRILGGDTSYFVNGIQIDKMTAAGWMRGERQVVQVLEPSPEPAEPPPAGCYEVSEDSLGIPLWMVRSSYPLSTAVEQSQITANTSGQSQFIRHHDGTCWVVHPDLDSAQRDPIYTPPPPRFVDIKEV